MHAVLFQGLVLNASASWDFRVALPLDLLHMPIGEVYPSDAHRGMDMPPVQASVTCSHSSEELVGWSNPTPVEGPGPDFSMPYNVAVVAGTAMAFIVGGMLNVLTFQARLAATPAPVL